MREGRVAGEAKKGKKANCTAQQIEKRSGGRRESEKDCVFHVREHSSGHAWMQGTLSL